MAGRQKPQELKLLRKELADILWRVAELDLTARPYELAAMQRRYMVVRDRISELSATRPDTDTDLGE